MHYFSDFCSCNNLIYSVMMQHNTDTRFPFIHAHISKFFVSNIKFWLSFTCIWLPMKWFSPFSVRWLCVSSVDYSEHTNELPISLALSCSRADSQPYKWLATPVRNREKKHKTVWTCSWAIKVSFECRDWTMQNALGFFFWIMMLR